MALYRFRIELSDVDRSVYEALDFRVAMHPSETIPFLLTRVLAYVLEYEDGIAFAGGGLSDVDEPALRVAGPGGEYRRWIEIGNPTARKLHKGAKACRAVAVYTYKDPELLLAEIRGGKVHRAEEISIYSLEPKFLASLAEHLGRDNAWGVMRNDGTLTVTAGTEAFAIELRRRTVGS